MQKYILKNIKSLEAHLKKKIKTGIPSKHYIVVPFCFSIYTTTYVDITSLFWSPT